MAGPISLTGDRALDRALSRATDKIQKKVMRASVRAGGTVLVKGMRRRVPSRTGALKRSLGQRVKFYRNSGDTIAVVGSRTGFVDRKSGEGRVSRRAHLTEFGTKPHVINLPGGRRVHHPGSKAHPSMRPTYLEDRDEAHSAIAAKAKERLPIEIRRAGR